MPETVSLSIIETSISSDDCCRQTKQIELTINFSGAFVLEIAFNLLPSFADSSPESFAKRESFKVQRDYGN